MRLFITTFFACLTAAASGQGIPTYVPANGLVGYYPLSKTIGLKDISGNGNDGVGHAVRIKDTLNFQFTAAADRFGNENSAMTFDPKTSDVTGQNHFTVSVRQPQKFSRGFSIGGWRYSIPFQFSQSFFSKDHTASQTAFEVSYSYDNSNYEFTAEGASPIKLSSPSDPLCFLGWHLVVGTFDGVALRLYADGELAAELPLSAADLAAFQQNIDRSGKFRIGSNVTPYVFNSTGQIDEAFIYNRALTPGEIQGLFQAGGNFIRRADIGFELGSITLDDNAGIYPLVTSATKPKAAAAINKTMQMVDFGKIRTPKNPAAIQSVKNGIHWSYSITWPTKRLLAITTRRETFNTESRGGETLDVLQSPHYIDMSTGDVISMKSFFTPEGYTSLARKLNERGLDLSKATLIVNPFGHQLTFAVEDADSEKTVTLPLTETNPALSATGNYYINDGPRPPDASPDHLWTGLIGTGIPMTLLVETDSPTSVKGMEVYDNFGTVIPMKGQFVNGVLTIHEMDDKGNVAGSFKASMSNRKLTGTWSNKDGSKTYPFSAVIAGE